MFIFSSLFYLTCLCSWPSVGGPESAASANHEFKIFRKKIFIKFQKEKLEFAGHQQLLGIDTMDKNLGKLWDMVRDREA